jgi:GTP-binding protein HflX
VAELRSLLEGLGLVVTHVLTQRHAQKGSPSVVGPGKLEELRALVAKNREVYENPSWLAFAADVTPSQQRILEREFETDVLDRSDVILRVFESRARGRLSRLELEVARLLRKIPRVRDDDAHDDREGGGGRGGRGDSNVELTKQNYRDRVAELRRQIDIEHDLRRRRETRRNETPAVALVGYTNSGKSSFMRALTGSAVLVENKLFATLDTTVRALDPPTQPRILVSDTVGFIQDLPHELVGSFRSTLDEALAADLLLQIVDAADERREVQKRVTDEVLAELGAQEVPRLLVFNKMDLVSPELAAQLREQYPEALFSSAHDAQNVAALRQRVVDHFQSSALELTLAVPFAELGRLSELRAEAQIVSEEYGENGVTVVARAERSVFERHGFLAKAERPKEAWE